MIEPPEVAAGQRALGEPRRRRHELAWTLELPDGRRVVVAQLAPELAAETTLRRRWVGDVERLAALAIPSLAPITAIGPLPDPRDPAAAPPWRVRTEPAGESLETRLERAPLPADEAIALVADLADAVQMFHAAGAVIRDLDPRSVVIGDDGRIWFTDVGHARLAILSSRTASSLLVESSPYAAPEALLQTVVDGRADVYSLGVVLWRALTGRVPFEASLLGARTALPDLATLRPELPAGLAVLAERCLARDVDQRPPTARDVGDALRGRGSNVALAVATVHCQACGAQLRVGLRLCLACGKQAVQFRHARPDDPEAGTITLHAAPENARFAAKLSEFFGMVADATPRLDFLTGDIRMYDRVERAQRHRLPATLLADLEPETCTALTAQLRTAGMVVRTVTPRQRATARRRTRRLLAGAGVAALGSAAAMALGGAAGLVLGGFGLVAAAPVAIAGLIHRQLERRTQRPPLARLRAAPAALPAGDAQVARIVTALGATTAGDVRARLEELAILVQRLCDAGGDTAADSVGALVELACTTAGAITAIDQQLTSLDEGALVRALARCEARREAPELRLELLAGLDTLRGLEDERAKLVGRLLEIGSLARVAIAHGLRAQAALRSDDVEVAHALAALDE